MMDTEVDVDDMQSHLGCGRFQIISFLVLGLIYSRGAWHVFGIMFLAGDPGHKCTLPELSDRVKEVDSGLMHLNISQNHGQNERSSTNVTTEKNVLDVLATLPTTLDVSSSMLYSFQHVDDIDAVRLNWTADSCAVSYISTNGSSVTLTEECPYGWSYGSIFETTVLSEWNLVCDNNFLVELSITVFMAGSTVGAMIILPLADRFGRKHVMMGCLLGQACVGTIAAFSNSYVLFTLLRCVVGMLNIGANLSAYVLMTETFQSQQRTVMSIAFQTFWAFGVMTVAGFGALVRHWRHLEILLSLPNLLAVPCLWFLPESLPWLISQKRWKEAILTVKMIARVNEREVEELISQFPVGSYCDNDSAECTPLQVQMKILTEQEENTPDQTEMMINCKNDSKFQQPTNDRAKKSLTILNSKFKNVFPAHKDSMDSESEVERNCAAGITYKEPMLEKLTNGILPNENSLCTNGCENVLNGTPQQSGAAHHEGGAAHHEGKAAATSHSFLDLFRNRRIRLYSCCMFFLFFVNSLGYFGISFSVPVLHGNPFINLAIMGAVEVPANLLSVLICKRVGRRYPNALFLLLCGVTNIGALFTPSSIVLLRMFFVMVGKFAITAAYSTIYLYSAEIFPTNVRNQGMGIASVFENIGSISAPFIVHAAKSIAELPLAVFGSLSIVGAGLTLLLPETHNKPLPQTIEEITSW